jgi:peptide chain release factor subunit 1
MEVVQQESFLEWIAEKYKDFGATLEFVSDRSSEGNQFVKGFGGIGGLLRYKVNFEQLAEVDDDDDYYDGMYLHLISVVRLWRLTLLQIDSLMTSH